jgi:UDP-GlcNAc:undecaprenyl-phosphate/decaprenyl-phosphate GlcNAc-1-phosphate transferase
LYRDGYAPLLLISLPIFIAGILEDVTARVSPAVRMSASLISSALMFFWLDISVNSLGFYWADYFLNNFTILNLLFTMLVVSGLINSINIIDGFNGLMSGYSIFVFLAIAYVANTVDDVLVLQLSLILMFSLLGFSIFNFPFGKIFMGDGGAYFIGLMMALIGLMLGNRNEEVSHWFILLLFIYPLYETFFSIYRRKIIQKIDVSQPDASHLHSLIYNKIISCERFKHNNVMYNSMTSQFLWLLSLMGIIPAMIWYDNQTMLIILAIVFIFIYTVIYKYISSDRFKFNH